MKKLSLGKSLLIFTLSLSNLFVLVMLFSLSSGDQTYRFFSTSMDGESLIKKIKQECKTGIQEIFDGERISYICNITVDGKHQGADYKFKSQFKVSKKEGKVSITKIAGRFADAEEHLSEATFCDACFDDQEFADSSATQVTEFMKEVEILANKLAENAEESSDKAHEEYNEANEKRAEARKKEEDCEGVWDKESESFEEFEDTEEKIECRMAQMGRKGSPLDVEKFYHDEVKKELWDFYLVEKGDEEKLQAILNSFDDTADDSARYSPSVRASADLLQSFISWDKDFDTLETQIEKERFLKNISPSVLLFASLMTKDQFEQDLYYLDKGFDEEYKKVVRGVSLQIDNARNKLKTGPSIDYDAASKEVQGFYY